MKKNNVISFSQVMLLPSATVVRFVCTCAVKFCQLKY